MDPIGRLTATRCQTGRRVFRGALLTLWAAASFGVAWFARDLGFTVAGWPLNFWLIAQGSVLVFLGIVVLDAWFMNRYEADLPAGREQP